jgi:hypothetical protein
VLSLPPAFVLSQDQTLKLNCLVSSNISPKAHIRTQGQSAAHVSLSSDSIVKQQSEAKTPHTQDKKRPSQLARFQYAQEIPRKTNRARRNPSQRRRR